MQKRKIAAAAAVTTVAAAGMVTGTLFHSPTELMDVSEPVPVVEHVSEEETAALERPREANRLRRWIRSLPPVFRLLVGVPLWGIGWVCLPALSALWSGAFWKLVVFGGCAAGCVCCRDKSGCAIGAPSDVAAAKDHSAGAGPDIGVGACGFDRAHGMGGRASSFSIFLVGWSHLPVGGTLRKCIQVLWKKVLWKRGGAV